MVTLRAAPFKSLPLKKRQMYRLFLVASCSGMRWRGRRQRDRHFVAGNVMATSYQLNGEPAEHRRQLSMGLAAGEYFR